MGPHQARPPAPPLPGLGEDPAPEDLGPRIELPGRLVNLRGTDFTLSHGVRSRPFLHFCRSVRTYRTRCLAHIEPAVRTYRARVWWGGLMDAADLARRFGLGRPARLSDGPVARGKQGLVWRLDTADGSW